VKAVDKGQIFRIPAEDAVLTIPIDGDEHNVDSISLSLYELYIRQNSMIRSIDLAYNIDRQVIHN